MEAVAGETAMETSSAGVTDNEADPCTAPIPAVTAVVPTSSAANHRPVMRRIRDAPRPSS